jgi:hypothetical protein
MVSACLPWAPARLEKEVEVEGDARQVTEVLEQREERKEDRHRRQHHADHPGGRKIHPVNQQALEPERQPGGQPSEPGMAAVHQQLAKQARGHVGAGDGQPQDHAEHQRHDREGGERVGEQAVEALLPGEAARAAGAGDAAAGQPGGFGVDVFGDAVVEVVGQLPAQSLDAFQKLAGIGGHGGKIRPERRRVAGRAWRGRAGRRRRALP